MKRPRLALALVAVLLPALVGCGSDEEPPSGSATSSSPSTSSPTAEVPEGWRTVEAEGAEVSFAVPKTWTIIDPKAFEDPSAAQELEKVAQQMNLSRDQFQAMLQQIDLMVMAPPKPGSGFTDNVNAVQFPLPEVPTAEALKAQLGTLGAEISSAEEVDTAVGEGKVLEYTLPLGQSTAHGSALFVDVGDAVLGLTVTTGAAGEAARLLDQLLPTLARLG